MHKTKYLRVAHRPDRETFFFLTPWMSSVEGMMFGTICCPCDGFTLSSEIQDSTGSALLRLNTIKNRCKYTKKTTTAS